MFKHGRVWMSSAIVLLLLVTATGWAAAASAAAKPVITLRWGDWGPRRGIAEPWVWFAEELEKQSGGRVKTEFYWGGTLAEEAEQSNSLRAGAFDIGDLGISKVPGRFPITEVFTNGIAFNGRNGAAASRAKIEVIKHPASAKELASYNMKYLFPTPYEVRQIAVKPAVKSLQDLKGLKIRETGARQAVLRGLGAVPVNINSTEVYDAISKGTIDGVALPWPSSMIAYSIQEVAKYHLMVDFGITVADVGMNLNTWNRLPADIQQIITKLAGQIPDMYDSYYAKTRSQQLDVFKKAGVVIIDLKPEEKALLETKYGTPMRNDIAKGLDTKGLPGRELMDIYMNTLAKYQKK